MPPQQGPNQYLKMVEVAAVAAHHAAFHAAHVEVHGDTNESVRVRYDAVFRQTYESLVRAETISEGERPKPRP